MGFSIDPGTAEQLVMLNDDGAGSGDSGGVGQPANVAPTERELAGAIAAVVSSRSSREEIRIVMRPLCARARGEQMNAAELVKVLKHSFATTARGTGFTGATERQQMLDRIISVCIDEYYAVG